MKSVGDDDVGRHRAWLCFKNDYLFARNFYVSKKVHLERAVDRMRHMDITNYVIQQRDSTKWISYLLTSINYEVTSTGYMLGGYVELPLHIIKDTNVICMNKSYSGNDVYTDCLCMFRCLTFHKRGVECYKKKKLNLGSMLFIVINYMLHIKKKEWSLLTITIFISMVST